ncbi:hypothetical protein B0T24DRAFT_635988 [Lasiosphaeria ovina]|uniref:Vacuolar protein sorting-associated protein TDA6 n=1 Tax=Lasiosphaeria ovina TaxID=92902 RepID=A0AAE0MZU1_9PEZI|nr:hypothetical protein B0T24DRAFT_635988 [Lasiosphaeria ovina]
MLHHFRRATIAAILVATVVFLLWLLPRILNPTPPDADERDRDQKWVNTSPYWLDRQACRWLGICGVHHLRYDPARLPDHSDDRVDIRLEMFKSLVLGWSEERTFVQKSGMSTWETAPMRRDTRPSRREPDVTVAPKILDDIPDFVYAHAPLVHLYSGEEFLPSDIAEHIRYMKPFVGGVLVNVSQPLSLDNLETLNQINGTVFLSSKDDVETRPEWLHSHSGVPVPFDDNDGPREGEDEDAGWRDQPKQPSDGTRWWDADKDHPPNRIVEPKKFSGIQRGSRQRRSSFGAQAPLVADGDDEGNKPHPSGYSKGPAVLILVDKGAGILDAFWFYFYSYNLGQTVLRMRFGNHVGDWEHCMTRFEHGVPKAMYLSEHAGGKAYAWQALEKRAQKGDKPARPIIYSAVGSHAMYASSGMHPYVLPFKMLKDITDKGPLWDPTLNNYAYWYDYEAGWAEEKNPTGQNRTSLAPASSNPDAPTSWFHFKGYWGDDILPLSDKRQWRLFGEYHYTDGPLGPVFKKLDRNKVCQNERCTILESIEAGKKSTWYS